jgi:hypothetical protein
MRTNFLSISSRPRSSSVSASFVLSRSHSVLQLIPASFDLSQPLSLSLSLSASPNLSRSRSVLSLIPLPLLVSADFDPLSPSLCFSRSLSLSLSFSIDLRFIPGLCFFRSLSTSHSSFCADRHLTRTDNVDPARTLPTGHQPQLDGVLDDGRQHGRMVLRTVIEQERCRKRT